MCVSQDIFIKRMKFQNSSQMVGMRSNFPRLCLLFNNIYLGLFQMMGDIPVYNPSVPYVDFIPAGMTPKRTIIIRGMVPYGANRFTINFKVAGSDDIAFHLTPRVMEGVVMRNSYLEGYWGEEENDINFCPFQEGQYFEISIRCGNRRYKVYVNGQHLCNFSHRIHPFGKVDRLEVIGDVQLSYIHF
ncbi:galectin-4-like [Brienomyrus brachyistius]|uniref:galectin-4-like n=1 Tax=Brienomyrus brachyistius TaxID=42636 RepID=UPI0020B1E6B8|nr:galectin-4-like [Brienomyrus brachyistius]